MANPYRCFDCFHDFGRHEDRFAVLKKLRDVEDFSIASGIQIEPADRRFLESMAWDQVFVCADCAGWYGDHPFQLSADEAGA